MAVSEAMPTTGLKYVVFYELLPSKAEEIDVELVVKSAYDFPFEAGRTGKRDKVQSLLRRVLFTQKRIP